MSRFVDGLLATRVELPPWPEAASGIRYSAEASDHDFKGVLSQSITRAMSRVLAITDAAEARVAWLSPSHLARWRVSIDDIDACAASNMDRLLGTTVPALISPPRFPLQRFSGVFGPRAPFGAAVVPRGPDGTRR
jgi:hypothetical protein